MNDATTIQPLVNAHELAHLLNVAPKTVLAWRRAGLIPGFKIGSRPVRFDPREVYQALGARADPAQKKLAGVND